MGTVDIKAYGKLVIIDVLGAATVALIDVRPPAGKQWAVLDLWMTHDDGAGANINFQYYDGTTTVARRVNTVAGGATLEYVRQAIAASSLSGQMVVSYDVYIQVKAGGALAAGKKLHAMGIALEYPL